MEFGIRSGSTESSKYFCSRTEKQPKIVAIILSAQLFEICSYFNSPVHVQTHRHMHTQSNILLNFLEDSNVEHSKNRLYSSANSSLQCMKIVIFISL